MSYEVISAFLDNEPFDAGELGRALADPDGRDLLLDAMALRALVLEDTAATPQLDARVTGRQRRIWIATGFTAATIVFGIGSVLTMKARPHAVTTSTTLAADAPPRPDRVVTFEPGLEWHDVNR